MLIRNDKDVQSKPLIRHVHDFVSSFVFYINIPDNCLKNQYLLKSPFACQIQVAALEKLTATNKLTHIIFFFTRAKLREKLFDNMCNTLQRVQKTKMQETNLCNRVIIKCDLLTILNFTYRIDSNLVMNIYSSKSAFTDKFIG